MVKSFNWKIPSRSGGVQKPPFMRNRFVFGNQKPNDQESQTLKGGQGVYTNEAWKEKEQKKSFNIIAIIAIAFIVLKKFKII